MPKELTSLEKYYKFLEKAKEKGENFTTRTRAFYKDMFLIHDRRENEGLELPPDVILGRRWNDSLQEINRKLDKLDKIEKETSETAWSISALFSGLGQAVAERKKKK